MIEFLKKHYKGVLLCVVILLIVLMYFNGIRITYNSNLNILTTHSLASNLFLIVSLFAVLAFVIYCCIKFSKHTPDKEHLTISWIKFKKIMISHGYTIFHVIIFLLLTGYVIRNWDICVSMQFFTHFDGNNILFLVWIVLLFLSIYNVEALGAKFTRRQRENVQERADAAKVSYALDKLQQANQKTNSPSKFEDEESVSNNGSSD